MGAREGLRVVRLKPRSKRVYSKNRYRIEERYRGDRGPVETSGYTNKYDNGKSKR